MLNDYVWWDITCMFSANMKTTCLACMKNDERPSKYVLHISLSPGCAPSSSTPHLWKGHTQERKRGHTQENGMGREAHAETHSMLP